MALNLAIAFPLHEGDRRKIRELCKGSGLPMPAIYPDSEARPCAGCGMTLAVGPRTCQTIDANGWPVYCLLCGLRETNGGIGANVINLGNPNGGNEK